jgi:hypothetical protein
MVVYELHLTTDWKAYLLRTQKSPGTEAPGLSLTPAPGATREEENIVTSHPHTSIPCQPRLFAKIPDSRPGPLLPLPR